MPDLPGRPEYWNIGYPLLGTLVYLTMGVLTVAILYGFWMRFRVYRLGKPMPDLGPWMPRIGRSLRLAGMDIFGHRRFMRREHYAGMMHFFLFWGIIFLIIATVVGSVEWNWHKFIAPTIGFEFPTVYFRELGSLLWDIVGGLFASIGLAMAVWRRYVIRPSRLNTFIDDGVVLALIGLLLFTGFLTEGLRIAVTELNPASGLYDPDAAPWSFIGYLFALGFRGAGLTTYGGEVSHFVLYWAHVVLVVAAYVYVAVRFSKLTHMFLAPLNAFLRSDRPLGALRSMGEIETLERFGASEMTDLTWKQLLDFDSCTNCGRCQDQCPAYASGKPLSPRAVIQGMKGYVLERSPALLAAGKSGEAAAAPAQSMVLEVITEDVLWSCTTCRACMEACPVFIEHIDTIVDMRRYLVMEEAKMPSSAEAALISLEQRGHPWRGTSFTRTDWTEGMTVPTMAADADVEVLFWVGCTGALEQRSQAIPRAMASVLKRAGVKYAILGNEETCTGDPARRMGNEYLYQILAQQNIETLNRYGVKKIVTICPHCFNTMLNEYPQLGGEYEVIHYSQFVADLIASGRIRPVLTIDTTVAYHDSCYLGRHNRVFDEPRDIARSIPGVTLVEMSPRNRERGFCCGAGGGRMWMDEPGTKVNHLRTDHFLETEAQTVGVSCPFCLQMLTEGIGAKGEGDAKQAKDILELLVESIGAEVETEATS